jgi:hypothetical protein
VTFQVFTQNPGGVTSSSTSAAPKSDRERYGLEAAKKNMATFTAARAEASLFAAEPMIQNPTNIDIDHRGASGRRVRELSQMDGSPARGDRVVILEDTDGDGLADKEKTFFQRKDLTNPLGICVLPKRKARRSS